MFRVAIVGASGLVGKKIIQILDEEKLLDKIVLDLYVSENNANKIFCYGKTSYRYLLLDEKICEKYYDVAFFSAGDDVSKNWIPKLSKTKYIIDNSNAFRRDKNVPLIVPEINSEKIQKNSKIIANPNCSTIGLALALFEINKIYEVKDVVVSTYQSVSGAGKDAIDDLKNGTNNSLPFVIKNNVIPFIGNIDENGSCLEENKINFELKKILKNNIKIHSTAIRVPTINCHLESVFVKFDKKIDKNLIENKLKKSKIISYTNKIKTLYDCVETNKTIVERLRVLGSKEMSFVLIEDNLRRGAAFNAVLIFKYILKKKYLIG